MRFGVLGPLVVWDRHGGTVQVPEARVRALLADLLIDAGAPISADRLLHDVWGGTRLAKPNAVLRSKISQLRRVLSQAEPDADRVLRHEPSGYRLHVEAEAVDAQRFSMLCARAVSLAEPAERVAVLDEALALWRGPAFAEVADRGFARAAITRLDEDRLTAREARAEAVLELPDTGGIGALADELGELAEAHPLRERLRAAHWHALYRAGRQAEALAGFASFRDRLRDELGLDPGPELVALHRRILRHDPGLVPIAADGAADQGPAPAVDTNSGAAAEPGVSPAGSGEAVFALPRDDAAAERSARSDADTARLGDRSGPSGSARTASIEPRNRRYGAGAGRTEPAGAHAEASGEPGPDGSGTATVRPRDDAAAERTARAGAPAEPGGGSGPADTTVAAGAGFAATGAASAGRPGTPLAALIGRDELLADLAGAVPGARLTSLVGPGGVGKTRLALAVAGRLDGRFADGVRFVELAGLAAGSTAEQLAQHLGALLGVRDRDGSRRDTADRLAEVLRDKDSLLIVDNCEHVLDAAAALLSRLLSAAAGLRVLTTSREPLSVPGELVRPVPPLELPGPDGAGSSAVALFAARARAADPGFRLTDDNAATVAAICRRLDGLPLALELAAGRVRGLGLRHLAEQLDDRFGVLAGNRGAPSRHQTLRATIDWSWRLLDPVERAVLRRVSPHPDCFAPEAAVAVAAGPFPVPDVDGARPSRGAPTVRGAPPVAVSAAGAVDVLARLVDRSLVSVDDSGPQRRYRLLESVAAYGFDELEAAGEAEAVRDRFEHHYLGLAESAESRIRGSGQRSALSALDAETVNLRAALDGMAGRGRSEPALRLANALSWYWNLRGRLGEARRSFALALSVPGGSATSTARARALAWRSALAIMTGDCADPRAESRAGLRAFENVSDPLGEARSRWLLASLVAYGEPSTGPVAVAAALERFTTLNDAWGVAAARSTLAWLALGRGDLKTARRDGEASLAMFRELEDHWGQLQALSPLVSIAEIHGDYPGATAMLRQGLRLARRLALWPEVSYQLSGLGRIALLTGRLRAADRWHGAALRLARDHADNYGRQLAELGLALGARRQSRLEEAERYLRHWLEWNRDRDGHAAVALMGAQLGLIATDRGDPAAAITLHAEALAAARRTGDPRAVAFVWEGLAAAAVAAGRPARAARLLGAAAAARDSVSAPLPEAERVDVDRAAEATRSSLGDSEFAARFAAGAAAGRKDPLQTELDAIHGPD